MEKIGDVAKQVSAKFITYKDVSTLERHYEENDGISETVQSDWIPIGEQVRMIMRGEVTVGGLDEGFDESFNDLEQESPDEVFEDATDYGTEYSDELRDAFLESSEQKQANVSAAAKETNEETDVQAPSEARTEDSE